MHVELGPDFGKPSGTVRGNVQRPLLSRGKLTHPLDVGCGSRAF